MSQQKKNINCRVCLRYDLKKTDKCFSLFEKYNYSLISDKIKYVANIEIKEGDGLPSQICPDCLLQLETAIVFKQKCETSNKILQSIVQQPSKVCKVKFRVPVKKEVKVVFNRDDEPDNHGADISDGEPEPIKPEKYEGKAETYIGTDTDNGRFQDIEFEPVNTELEPLVNIEIESENIKLEDFEYTSDNEVKKSRAVDLKLICDDCGGTFKSKCKLSVHWKKAHLHTKLKCSLCKRIFKSFRALNVHKKKNTRSCFIATKVRIEGEGRSRLFHCKECTYNTKRIKDMDAHLTTHTGDRRFQCHDCFKCFTQYSSLQGHRESLHNDYRIETTCQYCGKHIKGRNKYYKHLKIHEYKRVQCEICKKMLKCRTNLVLHLKRHTGIREHICEICSANFYSPAELCNHRRKVHFKARTFKCDMCEYSMFTAVALKTHRSRHTQDNVVCMHCGNFLENAEKLAIHEKKHLEKNFPCSQCEKGFFRRDSLRRHILKKHAVVNKPDTDKVSAVNLNIKQECLPDSKFDA